MARASACDRSADFSLRYLHRDPNTKPLLSEQGLRCYIPHIRTFGIKVISHKFSDCFRVRTPPHLTGKVITTVGQASGNELRSELLPRYIKNETSALMDSGDCLFQPTCLRLRHITSNDLEPNGRAARRSLERVFFTSPSLD